jgi:hypothetical protein
LIDTGEVDRKANRNQRAADVDRDDGLAGERQGPPEQESMQRLRCFIRRRFRRDLEQRQVDAAADQGAGE